MDLCNIFCPTNPLVGLSCDTRWDSMIFYTWDSFMVNEQLWIEMGILILYHSQVTKTCFCLRHPLLLIFNTICPPSFQLIIQKPTWERKPLKHTTQEIAKSNMFPLTGGHNNVPHVVVYCHHSGIISFELEHTLKFDICKYNISVRLSYLCVTFKLDQILSNWS